LSFAEIFGVAKLEYLDVGWCLRNPMFSCFSRKLICDRQTVRHMTTAYTSSEIMTVPQQKIQIGQELSRDL